MDYKKLYEMRLLSMQRREEQEDKLEKERNRNKGLEMATMMVGFLSEHQEYNVTKVISEFYTRYGADKTNELCELINNHLETIVMSLDSIEKHTPTR